MDMTLSYVPNYIDIGWHLHTLNSNAMGSPATNKVEWYSLGGGISPQVKT
jgi:hypothetical protein